MTGGWTPPVWVAYGTKQCGWQTYEEHPVGDNLFVMQALLVGTEDKAQVSVKTHWCRRLDHKLQDEPGPPLEELHVSEPPALKKVVAAGHRCEPWRSRRSRSRSRC